MSTALRVNSNKKENRSGFFRWKIGWLLWSLLLFAGNTSAQPFSVTANGGIVNESISEVTECEDGWVFSFETTDEYGHTLLISDNGTPITGDSWNISGLGIAYMNWGAGIVGINDGTNRNMTIYGYITQSPNTIVFSDVAPICKPTISVTGTLLKFITGQEQASDAQTVTVKGAALIDDIAVAALNGYEYSLDGTVWEESVIIPNEDGNIEATLFIRLKAGNTVGIHPDSEDEVIVLSSRDADNKEITLTGEVFPPAFSVTGEELLVTFATCPDNPSEIQSVSVSGSYLIDDITVAALNGYEYSLDNGTTWGDLAVIPNVDGNALATLSIRLKKGNDIEGDYTGEIILSSNEAESKKVAVTGEILLPSFSVDKVILASFLASPEAASASQQFTVSGFCLTDEVIITVTAPEGFEVSTDETVFEDEIQFTETGSKTVYVRLKAGLDTERSYSGDVEISTNEVEEVKKVAVSGKVFFDPCDGTYTQGDSLLITFAGNNGFVKLNDYEHQVAEGDTVRLTAPYFPEYRYELYYRNLAKDSEWLIAFLDVNEDITNNVVYYEIEPEIGAEYKITAISTSGCEKRDSYPLLLRTIFECNSMTGTADTLFFDDFGRFTADAGTATYYYTDFNDRKQEKTLTGEYVPSWDYPAPGAFWAPDPFATPAEWEGFNSEPGHIKNHRYSWFDPRTYDWETCKENGSRRIEDENYAIVSNPKSGDCGNDDFWDGKDHTNNTNGGMLFINVKDDPEGGVMVYERPIEIDGCKGVRVLFSAFISNAVTKGDVPVNVRLEVREDENGKPGKLVYDPVLDDSIAISSGDIVRRTQADVDAGKAWSNLSFKFNTTSENAKYWIQLYNNQTSIEGGNDILLDDISVTVCYPNVLLRTTTGDLIDIQSCGEVTDTTVTLKAWNDMIADYIPNPSYVFQYTKDTEKRNPNKEEWVWIDMLDEDGNANLSVDSLDVRLWEEFSGEMNVRAIVAKDESSLEEIKEYIKNNAAYPPLSCDNFFAVSDTVPVIFDDYAPRPTNDTLCYGQEPNLENLPHVPKSGTFSWQLKDKDGDIVVSDVDQTPEEFNETYKTFIKELDLGSLNIDTLLIYTLWIQTDHECNYPQEGLEERSRVYIKVNPLPVIDLKADTTNGGACFGKDVTVTLKDDNREGLTNYEWGYTQEDATLISGGGADDDFIKVKWTVSDGEYEIKKIWLNYTDGNGCRAALPDSIDVKVWAEIDDPEWDTDMPVCNTGDLSGTFKLRIRAPFELVDVNGVQKNRYEYSLVGDNRTYPFQSDTVFNSVENGIYKVIARDIISGCESEGTDLTKLDCGCENPPVAKWEGDSDIVCGVDPVSREVSFSGDATYITLKVENGSGELLVNNAAYVSGQQITANPANITYIPAAIDAGDTIRVIAVTDKPDSNLEGSANCKEFEAEWRIIVKPLADSSCIKIDDKNKGVPYCDGDTVILTASYDCPLEDKDRLTFVWKFDGKEVEENPFKQVLPGREEPYEIYISAYLDGVLCLSEEGAWKKYTIKVNPLADSSCIKIDDKNNGVPYCDGDTVTLTASYDCPLEDKDRLTFVWKFDGKEIEENPFKQVLPGREEPYEIYISAYLDGVLCLSEEGAWKKYTIKVNPLADSSCIKIDDKNNGVPYCDGDTVTLTASYDCPLEDKDRLTFVWKFDGKEIEENPFKQVLPGREEPYEIYISAYLDGVLCLSEEGAWKKYTIKVNPLADSSCIKIDDKNNGVPYCEGDTVTLTASYDCPLEDKDRLTFVWKFDGKEVEENPFKQVLPGREEPYEIYISAYLDGALCLSEEGAWKKYTIKVNPLADSSCIKIDDKNNGVPYCDGDTVTLTASYDCPLEDKDRLTFVWKFDGKEVEENPFKQVLPGREEPYEIYISAYLDGILCLSEEGAWKKYTIKVNPLADSSCIKIDDKNNGVPYCDGDTVTLTASYDCPLEGKERLTFVWKFDGKEIEENPFKQVLPGREEPYEIYISAYLDGVLCLSEEGAWKKYTIKVNPRIDSTCIKIEDKNNGEPYCDGDEVELTATYTCPGIDTSNLIFVWYFEDENGVSQRIEDNPFKRKFYAKDSKPTTYKFYISAYNDLYCESFDDARKEFSIVVNPSFDPDDFIVDGDLTICAKDSTKLTVTANGVINPVYRWYRTANDLNEDPFWVGATYQTPALTETTEYYVTVEGVNFCESKNRRKITVKVEKLPGWLEERLPNLIECAGNEVTPGEFTGTDLDQTKVTWTNSNPNIGLPASGTGNIPPFITRSDITKQEFARIIATPVSEFGCKNLSAIDTFTITVNPPSPLPVTQEVNILWDSLPESIEEGVIPTGEYTVYWYTDTTIVDTTGLTRPPVQGFPAKLDTLNTYIYWVKQVSKAGCSSPFNEVTVNVWYAYPPAVSDTVVCKDEPVDLNDLAKADDGYTLQWYTDNEAPKGTGSIEAPVVDTETPGVKKFYVSQKRNDPDPDRSPESGKAEITITVFGVRMPDVSDNRLIHYCAGDLSDALKIKEDSSGYYRFGGYTWSLNGQPLEVADGTTPRPDTNFDRDTLLVYEVKQFYVVNDNLTCYSDEPAVIEVQIGQSIELTIEATPGEIVREGTEISLIVTSSNNDHGAFEWFRDGQALETTFDATLSLPDFYESGEYKVMTTTSHDCPGVASVYLVAEVFIPNIITPYNENSLNDKFMQGSRSIQRVEIFNRYQQRIYEGDEGWDGTFRGQLAEPGTYFYRVVMKDGNVRKGTIEVAKF